MFAALSLVTCTLLTSIRATGGLQTQTGRVEPVVLIDVSAPPTPGNFRETARLARVETRRFTNPYIVRMFKNPKALKATASVCLLQWKIRLAGRSSPNVVKANWMVFDKEWAAKVEAQSRTWGPGATPPKSAIPAGTFSGNPLGAQAWHSSKENLARILVWNGRIVVEVIFQPSFNFSGSKAVFNRIRPSDLKMIESMAGAIFHKTEKYVSARS